MASDQVGIPMDAIPTAEQRLAALAMLPRRFGRRDPAGADAILAFVMAEPDDAARARRTNALSMAFDDERLSTLDKALAEAERFVAYAEAGAPSGAALGDLTPGQAEFRRLVAARLAPIDRLMTRWPPETNGR